MTVRVGEEVIVDQETREEKTPANDLPSSSTFSLSAPPWFKVQLLLPAAERGHRCPRLALIHRQEGGRWGGGGW